MNTLKMLTALGLLLVGLVGCGGGGDDHTPPAGMGSILLRNNTGDDLYVYFDGTLAGTRADYASTTAYDLKPGSYRVSLTERRGWRSWSGFVDVLQDRNTFMDVTLDLQHTYAYDVLIIFD
ncbi:MAG: hypothetical protein NTY53_07070 [Kiritimatiellaeota bacterium]|nr:hypothetical protein [Kiritimatiellota bacterium]